VTDSCRGHIKINLIVTRYIIAKLKIFVIVYKQGRLAQLARAVRLHRKGQGFKSLIAHKDKELNTKVLGDLFCGILLNMIEQFQQPKEQFTQEELKNILEMAGKNIGNNTAQLIEVLLDQKQKEGLSDKEVLERAILLAEKIILVDIKESINISRFED
jgi:hypothetical protein